jgi:TRAP-type C4-dicarboxylate transport system permease small subunit
MHGLHRWVVGISRLMALLGGAILSLLIIITCLSILGRALNTALHSDLIMSIAPGVANGLIEAGVGAIPGSFELVEAGMAFCIFAFLPYCLITMGHASVDVFTNALPRGVNKLLETLIAILFAVVLVTIAVQLQAGLERKMGSGQTSLLLEFPIWWSYMASFVGAVATAIVSIYMALLRLIELLTGRTVLTSALRAEH